MNKNPHCPSRSAFATLVRNHLVIAALLGAFASVASQAHAADAVRTFNIPAQSAATALNEFARQADITLAFSYELVSGERTNAVQGDLLVLDALARLLKGTKLAYKRVSDKTIAIDAASTSASRSDQKLRPQGAVNAQEDPSRKVRLAQVDQGTSSKPPAVEQPEQASEKKPAWIEEVLVTGSRIPTAAKQSAQPVKVYTREQIEQSGQTTITDFANTLPDVSIATVGNSIQTGGGATTIRLHGLPIGTTLILVNGHRVETSGINATNSSFDLSNIPLAAVERIEVVSEGSSAVYGSDAIAGVVNIILNRHFNGFEADAQYGFADGMHEHDDSVSWGKQWANGSLSVIGSFETRSELEGSQRSITGNNDYRPFGGPDARSNSCNPGNVFSVDGSNLPGVGAPYAAVPPGSSGKPTQAEFSTTAGMLNACSFNSYTTLIQPLQREGIFAHGDYQFTPGLELFSELVYSHVQQNSYVGPPQLFGIPAFQSFTVSATNPYNPFGATVGIGGMLAGVGRVASPSDTDFFRPLIGVMGDRGSWHWEVTSYLAEDRASTSTTNVINSDAVQAALNSSNPATALNPFVAGPYGSLPLLQSLVADQEQKFTGSTLAADALARGPTFRLPAGAIDVAFGGEYQRNKLYQDDINLPGELPNTTTTYRRTNYAVFGEARIPILAKQPGSKLRTVLEASVAGRHDHYDDFGGANTSQFGLTLRPLDSLLIRGAYSKSFQAPYLGDLYAPVTTFPIPLVDPKNGGQLEVANVSFGGNPNLKPQSGNSRTFGFVYSANTAHDFQVSINYWRLEETNSIQGLSPGAIVANEDLFPGDVIRNAAGIITAVNSTFINFGAINVEGLDYQLTYTAQTGIGQLVATANATQTYRYTSALTPGAPATDGAGKAVDFGSWAPRLKGVFGLAWKRGPYAANLSARYVSKYSDYNGFIPNSNELGNFWLCDANFHFLIGQSASSRSGPLRNAFVELGGVNIFNRLPQYSTFAFGGFGYDPAQADIRGRFLHARIGVRM